MDAQAQFVGGKAKLILCSGLAVILIDPHDVKSNVDHTIEVPVLVGDKLFKKLYEFLHVFLSRNSDHTAPLP